jgi:hypothetical protein
MRCTAFLNAIAGFTGPAEAEQRPIYRSRASRRLPFHLLDPPDTTHVIAPRCARRAEIRARQNVPYRPLTVTNARQMQN